MHKDFKDLLSALNAHDVPYLTAGGVHLTFASEKPMTVQAIDEAFKTASEGSLTFRPRKR